MKFTPITKILIFLSISILSCTKGIIPPESGSININIGYTVNGNNLLFDTINYTNFSGNNLSINKLEYYISEISLIGNSTAYSSNKIQYINAFETATNILTIDSIPLGTYTGIKFRVGIKPEYNLSYFLPPTINNTNMAWPTPMGGGYHFLKLEGHFIDNTSTSAGYAIHLGTNICTIQVELNKNIKVKSKNQNLFLFMEINEWFENPNVIDLNTTNYTMGDTLQMQLISANGEQAFTLK